MLVRTSDDSPNRPYRWLVTALTVAAAGGCLAVLVSAVGLVSGNGGAQPRAERIGFTSAPQVEPERTRPATAPTRRTSTPSAVATSRPAARPTRAATARPTPTKKKPVKRATPAASPAVSGAEEPPPERSRREERRRELEQALEELLRGLSGR